MNSEASDDARRQIAERAAHWLIVLQSEEASETLRAEFVNWLCASPLHMSEFLRISQLHRRLSEFTGWSLLPAVEVLAPHAVLQLRPDELPASPPVRAGRGWHIAALAAGLAAVCATGVLVVARMGQVHYRTAAGERREAILVDGSIVDLAPDSDLVVRYSASERLITLDHGDARFKVTKDPSRPFVVQAAQTRVRAVGTVFDVDRGARGVSVKVVEGRVVVSQQPQALFHLKDASAASPVLSLQANEQVSISSAGIVSGVHRIGDDNALVAGSEELAFDNETVAQVAQRFNRRNRTQIEILDAQLASRRISGVFRDSDPQSFVSFIQTAADVTVTRPDDAHIRLGSHEDGGRAAAP